MTQNKNVVNNETVNATAEVAQQTAPVVEQQVVAQPVEVPAATVDAGAQVPAEVTPQTFAEKHPKLAAFGQKAAKVGKIVGIGAAVVGGLFVAHKLGEASGFDKATDAYNNRTGNDPDPEPDYDPDDLGDEGVEEVDE